MDKRRAEDASGSGPAAKRPNLGEFDDEFDDIDTYADMVSMDRC